MTDSAVSGNTVAHFEDGDLFAGLGGELFGVFRCERSAGRLLLPSDLWIVHAARLIETRR